jgi:tetratricopeptide (TPR) repeat protein
VDLGSCYCYRHRRGPAAAPALAAEADGEGDAAAGRAAMEARRSRVEPGPPRAAAKVGVVQPSAPGVADLADIAGGADFAGGADVAVGGAGNVGEGLIAAADRLAANDLAAARRQVEAALSLDPSHPAAHMLEGFLHDLGGRDDEAAASYRAALYLDPALFQVRLLLADCLQRLGQGERAAHQYREVLATLDAGRARLLALYANLPLADHDAARERCRRALAGR